MQRPSACLQGAARSVESLALSPGHFHAVPECCREAPKEANDFSVQMPNLSPFAPSQVSPAGPGSWLEMRILGTSPRLTASASLGLGPWVL